MTVKELTKKNYVVLQDNEGGDILPVTDGKAVFVGDGSVKLNDKLTEVEGKVSTNESEIARVEGEYKAADLALEGKVSGLEGRVGTLETDKADKTQVAQDIETAKQELQGAIDGKANKSHRHDVSEIDGLGTVATLNIGTTEGDVPVLGANGKLDESMIPAIAINEYFEAESQEDALTKPVQNGDMVGVNGVTYICVNATKQTFEERFRPLNSVADAITRGEVETKLTAKIDKTEYELNKEVVQGKLDLKVDKSELTPINEAIDKKVEESEFSTYKTEAKGVTDALEQRIAINEGAIAGLAGSVKFRMFDIGSEDLTQA